MDKITKITKKKDLSYIEVNNKKIILFNPVLIERLSLKEEDSINFNELIELNKEFFYEKGMEIAFNYLSYSNRTIYKMKEHLWEKKLDKESITLILDRLIDLRYLDDKEFCKIFIQNKTITNPIGRKKFFIELKKLGVEERIAEEALEEFFPLDKEYQALLIVLNKAIKKLKDSFEGERKSKLYEKALSKGFSGDMVKEGIGEVLSQFDYQGIDNEALKEKIRKKIKKELLKENDPYKISNKIYAYFFNKGANKIMISEALDEVLNNGEM